MLWQLIHGALTAGVGSLVASLAVAPIDTIKTRLLVDSPSVRRLYPWAADLFELEGFVYPANRFMLSC